MIDVLTYFKEGFLEKLKNTPKKIVHIVVIATKPDVIKQAPLYHELRNKGEFVLLCHTGQHYDFRYSGGMEEEFNLKVDVHLKIEGNLHEKIAQMIERFGVLISYIFSLEKVPVPYIHGDTTTSMAIGLASFMHKAACVHVEAGLRTLTPKKEVYEKFFADFKNGNFSWNNYYLTLQDQKNYERGSMEPFPEQYNTRVSEPASGFFAAPVELNKDFILLEGFSKDRVVVTGNTVADATFLAVKAADKSKIFEQYPQLESGKFIRFCIHRRENTQSQKRFTVLIGAIERLLLEGYSILLISMFGTEEAIDKFNLRNKIENLVKEYPQTFIYSDVWPYYKDVIAAMRKCVLVATDSGSMQEEMNILGIPCITLRFGSDRSESLFAGGNLLAPPVDSLLVAEIIKGAVQCGQMKNVGNIYGKNVSQKIVKEVISRLNKGESMFRAEEERIDINF